ncbi:MAG: HAD family hydrolase [Steroidobacteraceae bacterium]
MSRPPVRVLCFDLDDTFWWVEPVLHRAEARMMEFLREAHPQFAAGMSPERVLQRRRQIAAREPAHAHNMTWLRIEALRELAREHAAPESLAEAAFEHFIAGRHEVEIFEDVAPALTALGEHYQLATFSNGNADIHRIGLGEHFQVSLNAESVGHAKPKAAAFHAVAEAMQISPAEMLYVGDDPINDIDGPRRAGCHAAWVNRRGLSWPATLGSAPQWQVSDLRELARLLLA